MITIAGGVVQILVEPDLTGFPGKLQAGLTGATGVAQRGGRAIAAALGLGLVGAAGAFKSVIDIGVEFQSSLNTLQAVSGATAQQMQQVSATAQALGSDLSLPATSAADAAAAMTELAKGGLSVDQAMTAAKGTLQLAAAAQIDAAKAAEIQTNALNAFGLSADQAGRVADVLANTANAASGEITDFAQAFQASGAVAHQFGVSLEDTSTALGIFSNAGIKGSDAGTLLKSMLLGLVNQSKPAQAALKELGVNAFDAQGQFRGLPVVFDQLRDAAARMTPQQYAAATATAFGSDAARAAGVAAGLSADGWDKMSAAVGKAGGAQELAGAKAKGLGGAIEGLKSQLETIAIDIFNKVSPALEDFVRKGAEGLPKIATSAGDLVTKLAPVSEGFLSVVKSLAPIGTGIANIVSSGQGLGVVGTAAKLLGGGLQIVATVLGPLASLVGGVLTLFSQLPGPIQSTVTALLLLRAVPALFTSLTSGLRGTATAAGTAAGSTGLLGRSVSALTAPIRGVASGTTSAVGAIRQFGGEMKLQSALALGYGRNLTTLQAAHAAYATSSNAAVTSARAFTTTLGAIKASAAAAGTPITTFTAATRALAAQSGPLGKIGTSFVTAASSATRFSTAAGATAAVGTSIKLGLGGLVSFLGGPWGVALAAAGVALALLGQRHQEAAAKASEQKAKLEELRGTLDTYSGAVTQATVAQKAQQLASDGTLKTVASLGIATDQYTKATLGQPAALQAVTAQLTSMTSGAISSSSAYNDAIPILQRAGVTLDDLTQAALGSPAALEKLAVAGEHVSGFGLQGAAGFKKLTDSIIATGGPAADLGRKLGISAEAVKNLVEQQKLAASASKDFSTTLSGIGTALGGLSSGVAPSEALGKALDALAQSARDSAQAAGEQAIAVGGNTVAAAEAARAKMLELRNQFIDTYKQNHVGVATAEADANALADSIGLIPDVAATKFTTNAPEVTAQVGQIAKQLLSVPGQKEIKIDAPTAEVVAGLREIGLKVVAIPGTKQVIVSLDGTAAQAKAAQLTQTLNAITAMAKVDADIAPGTAKGQQLKTTIDAIIAIIKIDGDPAPGTEKANELKKLMDGLVGILTADADTAPGTDKANKLKSFIDALTAAIPVDADTSAAEATINEFRHSQEGQAIKIPVLASGGASASGHAAGAYDVKGYANGGYASARRISNLRADVVRPGQMRLIGDNMRYDEAFIPLNKNSARSRSILMAAARRMGYDLVRAYADGGVATQFQQNALTALSNSGAGITAESLAGLVRAASNGTRAGDTYNIPVTTGSRISPADVANETVQRLRHARRGVHSDR